MKTLVSSWFGAFLLDAEGAVQEQALFPQDPAELAEVLGRIDGGDVLPEEHALAPDDGVRVLEERLLQIKGATLARGDDAAMWSDVVRQIADSGPDFGFEPTLRHDAARRLGRAKVRQAYTARDLHVVQAVDAIDELSAQVNVVTERLREWYALHAPELVASIEDSEELARLVAEHGDRDAIAAARDGAPTSDMGGPLEPGDKVALQALAASAAAMYDTRKQLEAFTDEAMQRVAPNVTLLTGAVLAARLLRHAGGLKRLATMPAGTIQTLGAEKALFRHIKEGSRPPKHGVLFNHPIVHRAPRHQRGALARAIAGKIALAARADLFTKNPDLGSQLMADIEKRAATIRVEHAKPRPRAAAPTGRPSRGPPQRGPPQRGPPRQGGSWAPRGDSRGPPRQGGYRDDRSRGPPRGPPSQGGYRDDRSRGPPRGPPRQGGYDRDDRPRGPPTGERSGPPRGPPKGPRGPPRGDDFGSPSARGPPTRDMFRRKPFGKKKDDRKGRGGSR